MTNLTIAIVGDINSTRTYDPKPSDPTNAKKAAEQLGEALAKSGLQLLVYGGPYLESDVVRGYVKGKPKNESIIMWYTKGNEPPPFDEEKTNPKLFKRQIAQGLDWEIAFYRAIATADGIVLMGGDRATHISGQMAIGSRMPILALSQFGGGAARVWDTLSPGEDLPNRDELSLMTQPWTAESAERCVKALVDQRARKQYDGGRLKPGVIITAGILFVLGLAIVSGIFGGNQLAVWMLFLVPVLLGGAGAAMRQMVDRQHPGSTPPQAILASIVLGLGAGGIAGVLFVMAQRTSGAKVPDPAELAAYAKQSIPFAFSVGFIAGLTSDAVFGKLLGMDVIKTTGVSVTPQK